MKKGLEDRLIETLKVDKKMLPFFKAITDKNFQKDKIIDITNTTYQMDLCEYPIDPGFPFRYGLLLLNLSSNQLYGEAIERKDADSVLNGFKRIITRYNPNIKRLQTDKGGEFQNKKMRDYCESKDIYLYTYNLYNKNSMGPIEGFIGLVSKVIYIQMSILTVKEKTYNQNIDQYNKSWVSMFKKAIDTVNTYFREKYPVGNKYTLFDIYKQKIKTDKQMFQINDKVHLKNKKPASIVDGKPFYGEKWRYGDLRYDPAKPHIITDTNLKSGRIVRYILDNKNDISYKMSDLKKI